jgi:hypothetical protein
MISAERGGEMKRTKERVMRRKRATQISTTKGRATRSQKKSNRRVLTSGRQRKRPQRIKLKRPQKVGRPQT